MIIRQASKILFDHGIKILEEMNTTTVVLAENGFQYFKRSMQLHPTKQCAQILIAIYSYLLFELSEVLYIQQNVLPALYGYENYKFVSENLNDGINAHKNFEFATAINYYEKILYTVDADCVEALFHKGVSYQHSGNIQAAADMYYRTVQLCPIHTKAIINMATLHHKFGRVVDSIPLYSKGIAVIESFSASFPEIHITKRNEEYFMLYSNMALAYMQMGNMDRALQLTTKLLSLLQQSSMYHLCDENSEKFEARQRCLQIMMNIYNANGNLLIIQQSSVYWKNWEFLVFITVRDTLLAVASNYHIMGPILPFTSLLLPLSLQTRLQIAQAINSFYNTSSTGTHDMQAGIHTENPTTLRIGFISFDFNNHPTAHLVEAIFNATAEQRRGASGRMLFSQVQLIIYSYGKQDNSTYSFSLRNLADKYNEISLLPYHESINLIERDSLHILLDLQLHTWGNRLEITAGRPAPIQVNYLVYPGTSGVPFIDYIVADSVVLPVEDSRHYSESILLLPPSYQISLYDATYIDALQRDYVKNMAHNRTHYIYEDGYESHNHQQQLKKYLRRLYGLPVDDKSFLFCNFNKVDKIDPVTFTIWMSILRRVHNSYLWLLEPSYIKEEEFHSSNISRNAAVENILSYSKAAGVDPKRILFASRGNKVEHIVRHAAGDLFLDTLIYGAHSTATDSMRGSLPVLTIRGDSFPNRVAASLLVSLDSLPHTPTYDEHGNDIGSENGHNMYLSEVLVADSLMQYEDMAVRIAMSSIQQHRRSLFKEDSYEANIPNVVEYADNSSNQSEYGRMVVLDYLKQSLRDAIHSARGIFCSVCSAVTFIRGMQALYEVDQYAQQRENELENENKMHVILL